MTKTMVVLSRIAAWVIVVAILILAAILADIVFRRGGGDSVMYLATTICILAAGLVTMAWSKLFAGILAELKRLSKI